MSKIRSFFQLCLLATALFTTTASVADTVLGIVSPRNANDVLSGAHAFLEEQSEHSIQLRTTHQFSALSEQERQALLADADLVLAGGVFGSAASQLLDYLNADQANNAQPLISSFIALHSDSRLVPLSHLRSKALLAGADLDALMADPPPDTELDIIAWSQQKLVRHESYRDWLLAKTFWSDRDTANMAAMFSHLFSVLGHTQDVPEPTLRPSLRMAVAGENISPDQLVLDPSRRWVAVLDYETGDRPGERELLDGVCENLAIDDIHCLRVYAKWGSASIRASELLATQKDKIGAVISIQNFVVGGGEGRKAVTDNFESLNVPVLKAIRLSNISEEQWQLSEQGLPQDSVHYRVAMPELQGISQPLVVAAMTPPTTDARTGLLYSKSTPIDEQLDLLARRAKRWLTLQTKNNADKKLAVIYYNHPPGRHNIGADNLNVPSTLFSMLNRLQAEGYNTGPLPKTELELLDLLQERGINLPEDRQALAAMAKKVNTVDKDTYSRWLASLPDTVQHELVSGPLGYLHGQLQRAIHLEDREVGLALIRRVSEDIKHAAEGAEHPARDRVLDLLQQLREHYEKIFKQQAADKADWAVGLELVEAIAATGLEGVRGWGESPGKVMVHEDNILLPGIQFGNVFVGPQPPRGWELNEELLHANLSFPPTHQYLALYQWLRKSFQADAVVHVGRHSTYEFLPRHRVGLGQDDYPLAVLDDLPSVYPYIVDGVGEGIQAKRRGLAVMVDHLTPPLDSTELYDQLLALRQLIESYQAAPSSAGDMRQRAVDGIKQLVDELKLKDELTASMSGELEVRGITEFDQVDDDLLVHEVGHYLTHLQEDFMPLGLHTFGKDWSTDAINTMLESMAQGASTDPEWREQLTASPSAEITALLAGLDGRFIAPGKGNDPIRTPEVLPTGRNFFALDSSLIPSKLGYQVGSDMAAKARALSDGSESEAVILWASDVVRDEGAMIAFGYDMLGVKPVWNSRGIIKSLERLPMEGLQENGSERTRRDALFTTSGLFRDLYGSHLLWLEQAVLMALDASSNVILRDYPALTVALESTLEPLGVLRSKGSEALDINLLAARWVEDASAALRNGYTAADAGQQASYRVFGDPPGSYGAGVNTLVERSGSWEDRSEVAAVYKKRMSHAYGRNLHGEPQAAAFEQRLSHVGSTYLGQSSNLYGLLDNNDTFDYLGGLSLAVEFTRGNVPDNYILVHPDDKNLSIEPLNIALLSELRTRFLSRQWLVPLMDEGYAGARTMGSEFIEYLWGWQVTNPDVVKSWAWDEVKKVYVDDALDIGLDSFLEENHNVHVKSNILAVMLVAAEKQFWDADQQTLQEIATLFARLILENGLPGSGHTTPDHAIYDFIEDYVPAQQYAELQALLDNTRVADANTASPSTVAEITTLPAAAAAPPQATESNATPPVDNAEQPEAAVVEASETTEGEQASEPEAESEAEQVEQAQPVSFFLIASALAFLLLIGLYLGMRSPHKNAQQSSN